MKPEYTYSIATKALADIITLDSEILEYLIDAEILVPTHELWNLLSIDPYLTNFSEDFVIRYSNKFNWKLVKWFNDINKVNFSEETMALLKIKGLL